MELVAEKRERRRPKGTPKPQKKPRQSHGTRRLWRVFGILAGLIVLGGGAATGGVLWVFWEYGRNLPQYSQLARYEPPVVTRIHAGNGALLAEYATEKRVFIPVGEMPAPLIEAFLSAEDKGFYDHFGIDPKAMIRAAWTNLANRGTGRRLVGASTITQQVAKNFLLTNEVSLERKIKEAILAIRMERAFSKDQLLELYMNEIYLGFGSYGVAAAALNYFDKALADLTLAEMAYLAALPKAPNNYHPTRKYKAALGRRNWVLRQMQENGFITAEAAGRAMEQPLTIRPLSGVDGADAPYFAEEVRRQMTGRLGAEAFYSGGYSVQTTLNPRLQRLADRAIIEGLEALDKRQGWRGRLGTIEAGGDADAGDDADGGDADLGTILARHGGRMHEGRYAAVVTSVNAKQAEIIVMTGRDADAPRLMEGVIPFSLADWAYPPRGRDGRRPRPLTDLTEALSRNDIIMVQRPEDVPDRLARMKVKTGSIPDFGDDVWALGQRPLVEGALVALDPHTGRVLAMTGGYNPLDSEFNRATQAHRQPGSAFKPFVYLAALDNGFSPITRILDAPLVLDQGPGLPKWKPSNYTRRFYGPSIMRQGIEQSRNLMTVRLAMAIGMPQVQDYASRFGVDPDMPPILSMALGAGETTLMQLTAAYGMVANGGAYITPSIIDRVQDRFGTTIYRHDERVCEGCVVADISDDATSAPFEPPLLPDRRKRVTDKASAYQMVSMLEGVISRGTGRLMGNLGFAVAGKTGTTNDNTNGWFVGFTPDLVVGIYVGFDTPKPLGRIETGSTVAVPIFADFMRHAMAGQAHIPFRRPQGINLFRINALNGQRAQSGDSAVITEAFKPGQRPLAIGSSDQVIDVPGADTRIVAEPLPGLY